MLKNQRDLARRLWENNATETDGRVRKRVVWKHDGLTDQQIIHEAHRLSVNLSESKNLSLRVRISLSFSVLLSPEAGTARNVVFKGD